jgi:dual specificity protein phosphatase-like protein
MWSGVDRCDSRKMNQRAKSQEAPVVITPGDVAKTTPDQESNGAWPLHRYSVVDGGDIVGIMQRNAEMVRIPAWSVIGDHLILGAHPADTMPPNVDAIANVDSFRFYDVPDGVLYLHFAYRDANVIPDSTDLHIAASFLNDLRAAGKTVFIHCRLGLNRSALLTGLVLIDEGYRAKDAIEMMRNLRSPYVLENKTFERYLLSDTSTNAITAAASSEPAA